MPNQMTSRLARRFWAKVNKLGPVHPVLKTRCWLWTATITTNGYGQFRVSNRVEQAHRVSWYLAHSKWPRPCALHKCDVRNCVRPDHLFEGTIRENTDDKMRKGRWGGGPPRGERNGNAKLTESSVLEIRRKYARGHVLQAQLAKAYSVSRSLISNITSGAIWGHLSGEQF